MVILPKAICRFYAIPIKIPTQFFTDLKRSIIHFTWKTKKPRVAKTVLYNKGISRGITIPDIKLYYRATIIKAAWYWHKNREVDQWNWIKDPDINPHTYEHLIFDEKTKIMQWKKESIFNKRCWHNWISTCIKLKSKWIKDVNINQTTLILIEEKKGSSLQCMGTGYHLLNITLVVQTRGIAINKWIPCSVPKTERLL